ncbi:hypothetical protein HDU86_007763 [Geranomyces michiganensis]|nr:hypothetical protein HDU86_007763 [Geranomyces michiganensis]
MHVGLIVANHSMRQIPQPQSQPVEPDEPPENLDELLPCAKTLTDAAREHPNLDQSRKDMFSLMASTMTKRSRAAYHESLEALPLHIANASVLGERLERTQTCWEGIKEGTYAICAIQRDTGPFIQEWLVHNLLLGAEKVLLYDNSEPNSVPERHFHAAVKPFVDLDYVETVDWLFPGENDPYQQIRHQNDCLNRLRGQYEWVAMIDTDEFLVIHEPHSPCLNRFLVNAPANMGGLIVRWRGFTPQGSALHDHSRLFLEQYKYSSNHPSFGYVKSIVNLPRTQVAGDPHFSIYKDGFSALDASNNTFTSGYFGSNIPPDGYKDMELRHYWARDLNSAFQDKVCGTGSQRTSLSRARADILMSLYADKCCTKVEAATRHDAPLRAVLYGP